MIKIKKRKAELFAMWNFLVFSIIGFIVCFILKLSIPFLTISTLFLISALFFKSKNGKAVFLSFVLIVINIPLILNTNYSHIGIFVEIYLVIILLIVDVILRSGYSILFGKIPFMKNK